MTDGLSVRLQMNIHVVILFLDSGHSRWVPRHYCIFSSCKGKAKTIISFTGLTVSLVCIAESDINMIKL